MAFSVGLGTLFRNQFKNFLPSQDPSMEQALRMIQNPLGMPVVFLVTLAMLFVFITSLAYIVATWRENDWPSQRLNHAFCGFPPVQRMLCWL